MKQLFSVLLLAVLFTGFINAQSQGISIGANVALPMGDWSDGANTGFGGTATYEEVLLQMLPAKFMLVILHLVEMN